MTSALVRQRQLRAHLPLGLGFVGVPLLIAGYGVLLGRFAGEAARFEPRLAVPGAVLAAVGLVAWFAARRRPGRWADYGLYFGLAGALVVLLLCVTALAGSSLSTVSTIAAVAPAAALTTVACWALGSLASRMLTFPVLADLADSRVEWAIPLRGVGRAVLLVGTDAVGVRRPARPLLELIDLEGSRGTRYPLSAVTWIRDATSSGVAPARLPKAIATDVQSVSGSAVGLRVDGHDWVLPVDDAPQVVELLRRRVDRQ